MELLIDAAAAFELVISAMAYFWGTDNSKILSMDATNNEMMKAPHKALMIDMILPNGDTAATSP